MSALQKAGFLSVLTVCGVYVYMALRGPQGLPALQEKWQEIRRMQQRNAELERDVEQRAARIQRLKESPAEQELEIRKRLKMLRPGETTFIIPNKPAPADDSKP
ncbi:MAG: septum formation initiator family protein [Bryobacterales bacterium]|nr:septum formation initiator family protein [Bryobacterales bacterium]MCZ2148721.1 septum formation initiator family protein [Bryobacterales bacterium]